MAVRPGRHLHDAFDMRGTRARRSLPRVIRFACGALRAGVSSIAALVFVSGADAAAQRIEWSPPSGELRMPYVRVPGCEHPVRILRLEIPPDGRVRSVEIRPVREEPLPAAPPAAGTRLEPATSPRVSGGYRLWVLRSGDLRGHRIAHVAICPFRSDGDRVLFLSRFDVDVATVSGETSALPRRNAPPRTARADAELLERLLDAPPLPPVTARGSGAPPELAVTTVEYLIVTTEAMAPAFQELADLKTGEGTPAEITTVEWILDHYDGNDPAARVRAYIRDVYRYRGLEQVLLGGDTEHVPSRVVTSYYQAPDGVFVVSDKYFAGLDGSWNRDGDDRLGEPPRENDPGDDADVYADVMVGRMPLSTPEEVTGWIGKWKSYTGYDRSGFRTDYQDVMLSIGEVLFPADWDVGDDPADINVDGADLCEQTLVHVPPAISPVRLYEYFQNPEYPEALPLHEADVTARINAGCGILDHVGHGYRSLWSIGDGNFTTQDADALENTGAYPFVYAANCNSGAVNFDCLMEHLLENPAGGIVSGIASTEYDYPFAAEAFKEEFFRLLFAEDQTTLGSAFYGADLLHAPVVVTGEGSFRWTLLTFIALGDPGLEIWRDTPRELELSFDPLFTPGSKIFSVAADDGGVPVPGVRIALLKEDGYGLGVTGANGIAAISFDPVTPGSFRVTATRNGYVPQVATAEVVAPTAPVLRIESWAFHDGTAGGGGGNADGRPDAGELVVVDLTLRNDGDQAANDVVATLHGGSSALSVSDSVATSASISPGGQSTIPGAFAFSVSPQLPDTLRHVVVPALVDLAALEGTWSEERPFSVYQRLVDLVAVSWLVENDDGDGELESGETAALDLVLCNVGEAEAIAVTAHAYGVPAGFTIVDSTILFGDMVPGVDTAGGPIRVRSDGGGSEELTVAVAVTDVHETELLTAALDIRPPAPPDSLDYDPGPTSIHLVWPPPGDEDLRGYHVYRASAPGGPYERVTPRAIEDGAFFSDHDLEPLTQLWYRVASADSSGNVGAPSDSIRAGTSPPSLSGWPVPLPPGQTKGSPTWVDLAGDGRPEVLMGWSHPMAFTWDGGEVVDGDGNGDTIGVLSGIGGGQTSFWNSPAAFDIDRDGVVEIVYCAWQLPGQNVGYMYVLDATGAVEPGWPRQIGAWPWSTAALGNVDADAELEIFVSSGAGWGPYQGALHGFNHDGTEILDGDGDPATIGVFHRSSSSAAGWMYGSPAIADLDGDGRGEIVFVEKTRHVEPTASTLYVFDGDGTVLPGFPFGQGLLSASTASPAVADVDGDGDREIVVVTQDLVVVVSHEGSIVSGWPRSLPPVQPANPDLFDFLSSPAVGDVNGDGDVDIALGWLDGMVHLWTARDGTAHPGFPVQMTATGRVVERYMHSPILGNVDGDPLPEIVVSSGYAELYAVKGDATSVPGFPIRLAGTLYGSPAICDLDGDGMTDLIAQSDAGEIEVFTLNVPHDPVEQPWPMFRHDPRKSGSHHPPGAVAVPGSDPPAVSATAVHPPRPNPFSPRVELPFDVGGGEEEVTIRIVDVHGRQVRVLADGVFPGGRHRISWDGRTENGRALAAGVYFVRIRIGPRIVTRKLTLIR